MISYEFVFAIRPISSWIVLYHAVIHKNRYHSVTKRHFPFISSSIVHFGLKMVDKNDLELWICRLHRGVGLCLMPDSLLWILTAFLQSFLILYIHVDTKTLALVPTMKFCWAMNESKPQSRSNLRTIQTKVETFFHGVAMILFLFMHFFLWWLKKDCVVNGFLGCFGVWHVQRVFF